MVTHPDFAQMPDYPDPPCHVILIEPDTNEALLIVGRPGIGTGRWHEPENIPEEIPDEDDIYQAA